MPRSTSSTGISAVPPPLDSPDYSAAHAQRAKRILYKSPLPSPSGLPLYVVSAAAFPDAREVEFDALLPYVLARLPGEDELLSGTNYEVVFFAGPAPSAAGSSSSSSSLGDSSGGGEQQHSFFAGGGDDAMPGVGPSVGSGVMAAVSGVVRKSGRPGWSWFLQAYQVFSRALRKRLQRLYIVHQTTWVRFLVEAFSTVVSPKSRKKIWHVSTLTALALQLPIENLLIPPSAYLYDRKLNPDIFAPYVTGKRAFGAMTPLPRNSDGTTRLPRVLRETSRFLLLDGNVSTVGIFRLSPPAKLLGVLREAYDRGQKFIVWKGEAAETATTTLPCHEYPGANGIRTIIAEVEPHDAYGVDLAASLIKDWYRQLATPIFPACCYTDVRTVFDQRTPSASSPYSAFSDSDTGAATTTPPLPTTDTLVDLLSRERGRMLLPASSQELLVRHLLPLLARVARASARNRMPAYNLAVCFAPALLRGPDQLLDAKMSSVVRRVLEAAIASWDDGLREALGVAEGALERDLESPLRADEYEDPLDDRAAVEGEEAGGGGGGGGGIGGGVPSSSGSGGGGGGSVGGGGGGLLSVFGNTDGGLGGAASASTTSLAPSSRDDAGRQVAGVIPSSESQLSLATSHNDDEDADDADAAFPPPLPPRPTLPPQLSTTFPALTTPSTNNNNSNNSNNGGSSSAVSTRSHTSPYPTSPTSPPYEPRPAPFPAARAGSADDAPTARPLPSKYQQQQQQLQQQRPHPPPPPQGLSTTRRKPVPPPAVLPRYSSIVRDPPPLLHLGGAGAKGGATGGDAGGGGGSEPRLHAHPASFRGSSSLSSSPSTNDTNDTTTITNNSNNLPPNTAHPVPPLLPYYGYPIVDGLDDNDDDANDALAEGGAGQASAPANGFGPPQLSVFDGAFGGDEKRATRKRK